MNRRSEIQREREKKKLAETNDTMGNMRRIK